MCVFECSFACLVFGIVLLVGSSADSNTSSSPIPADMSGVTGTESRMKKALESMVQKLEKKIDTTEAALGEKMNRLLDTDRDGEEGVME